MRLIIITGQTATGKTKLALNYAKKYNGELINCDSRQIYKYLNIITGKDLTDKTFIEDKKINNFSIGYYRISSPPHVSSFIPLWLYDVVDPKQYFSSYDYSRCSLYVIKKIFERNKIPIIVGGSYFYLKHLLYGFETDNIPPIWPLRRELETKSIKKLQQILKKLSLQCFKTLKYSDKNNPRRLIRKIEILNYYKNNPQPEYPNNQKLKLSIKEKLSIKSLVVQFIGLRFKNKDKLRKMIKERVEKRLKNGAIEEVKTLLKKGYTENDPGLKTIGYQQIISYIKGSSTKQEAINEWIIKETQYAKRQYTFMNKDKNIDWLSC